MVQDLRVLKNPRKSGKGLRDLEIFLRKWEEVFGAGGVGGRRPQKQDVQTHYTVKNISRVILEFIL